MLGNEYQQLHQLDTVDSNPTANFPDDEGIQVVISDPGNSSGHEEDSIT